MFRHVMGNDPKPHYAHQPNLMLDAQRHWASSTRSAPTVPRASRDHRPAWLGATRYFNVPLVQPTFSRVRSAHPQGERVGRALAGQRRQRLPAGREGPRRQQHRRSGGGPLTGTTGGELYGGQQRSGWVTVNPGDNVFTPADPLNVAPPTAVGAAAIGATINAAPGQWLSGAVPGLLYSGRYQWQRCNGNLCSNLTGVVDANYKTGAIDSGFSIRVVEMAGNWVSSVSQAASNQIQMPGQRPAPGVVPPTDPAPGNVAGGITRLTLTGITVSPRRFKAQKVVKVRGKKKSIGGTTIRWRLNVPAKVQIVVQKKKGKRWVNFGSIQRDGKAGAGKYLFTGRIVNNKLIGPAQYRFVISASRNSPRLKTPAKTITFTFLKG